MSARSVHQSQPRACRVALIGCAFSMVLAAGGAVADPAPPAVVDLSFGSFYVQPVGPRGLQISAALYSADGQRVRLTGYVVEQDDAPAERFLFSSHPLALSEHADGAADDLPPTTVTVLLPGPALQKPPAGQRLRLTGTLRLGRTEHADGRVSWVRLILDPPTGAIPSRLGSP